MLQPTTHQIFAGSATASVTEEAKSSRNHRSPSFTEPTTLSFSEKKLHTQRTTTTLDSTDLAVMNISDSSFSTLATTAVVLPAKSGEAVIILQVRIQRVFIPAYTDPSSTEYKTLVNNITAEVINEQPLFLQCIFCDSH